MKLYHGTNSTSALKAVKDGILPRSLTGTSNWDHTVQSHPDAVYLTDAYPLYFGIAAADSQPGTKPAIIEIDTSKLDLFSLHPDEDVLAQAGSSGRDDLPLDWDLNQRSAHYRETLFQNPNWDVSLKAMGTCCHDGPIPVKAITRVAIIDHKKNPGLCWTAMDASISLSNYRYVGGKYRNLTRWIFGYPVIPDDCLFPMEEVFKALDKEGRDGIEITEAGS